MSQPAASSPVRSARGEELPNPTNPANGQGLDRLARDAYLALHVADSRFTHEVEELCREADITQAQFTVLWVVCVSEEPAGLPIGTIADGLLTRAADTSRLVDRLLTGGYVTRTPSPDDRRVAFVRPTAAGRRLFARVVDRMNALHRRQWAVLDRDELTQLIALINKALWSGSNAPNGVVTRSS
jgi:DNA-binding MarR family transcriptional regulator